MAPSLNGRIELHRADYHAIRDKWGRGWITIDKEQVWSCEDDPWFRERLRLEREIQEINDATNYHDPAQQSDYYRAHDQVNTILRQQAVMYSGDFDELLKSYLSLPIEATLDAESPLVRALAMTDGRVGKRRLRALAVTNEKEHSLVKLLYHTRCAAEGINPTPRRYVS